MRYFDIQSPALDATRLMFKELESDKRASKIDLGIGIYRDEKGEAPVFKAVKKESVDILIAKCSRAVVDLNRSRNSIDNDMFNGVVIFGQPDEKKMRSYGLGVFPKIISNKSIFKT